MLIVSFFSPSLLGNRLTRLTIKFSEIDDQSWPAAGRAMKPVGPTFVMTGRVRA